MSWYMAVRTDFSKDGYRPGWDDGAHVGSTPSDAMQDTGDSHVYLMWHMETPHPGSKSLVGQRIPVVCADETRMVVKVTGRILMLDGCHLDELTLTQPPRGEAVDDNA
jgi:hypothetical protein